MKEKRKHQNTMVQWISLHWNNGSIVIDTEITFVVEKAGITVGRQTDRQRKGQITNFKVFQVLTAFITMTHRITGNL